MSAFDGCTQADYEAAAHALAVAMEAHAKVRLVHNKEGYKALLEVRDFHDRCLVLARSIATERENQAAVAAAKTSHIDGTVQRPSTEA